MSAWPFDSLRPLSYDVIVCDPPWRFRTWSETNQAKSASKHYDLMQTEDIKALPVGELAQRDCILLLWTTGAMQPQAFDVMNAWGFTYKSQMIWRKTTALGKVRMGTGYWARSMHEPVLIGCMENRASSPRSRPCLMASLASIRGSLKSFTISSTSTRSE